MTLTVFRRRRSNRLLLITLAALDLAALALVAAAIRAVTHL
jgi:hypothetical protein